MVVRSALVVEDIAPTRRWLVGIVRDAIPAADVRSADSVAAARALLRSAAVDLAVVDIQLGDGCGIDLVGDVTRSRPEAEVVMATTFEDEDLLFRSLRAGARGYLLKNESRELLTHRLEAITQGEPAISPRIARRVLAHFHCARPLPTGPRLSPRETDVLTLVAKGLTRPEVARLLTLQPHTVNEYLKTVYRKLDVSSRAEATLEALRLGLIE